MIPILYPANETAFTSNGLGRLSDCISCKVTEERNGIYECEFEYPITGSHFGDIAVGCYIMAKPNDTSNPQAFRIYKASKPMGGKCTFNAEHISYRLNYIPVMPYTAGSCLAALQGLATYAAETCPFTFSTDKVIATDFEVEEPASIRSVLGGEAGSILEAYKGEFEFDMFSVFLWQNRGANNGVKILYGKNLKTLEQEESIESTYTGVCPFWRKEEEDGTITLVTLPEKVLHHSSAGNYPYPLTLVLDMSSDFENAPTENELRSAATAYMVNNNIGIPEVNLKVDFIALWQTLEYKNLAPIERVNLCDTVTVEFTKLGVEAIAKVIKTTYDTLMERYTEIELGDAKSGLGDTIAKISEGEVANATANITSNYMNAINHATDLLRGGLGGHVVIGTNASGEPNEILIMDADNVDDAVNIIRLNSAGIGFSQSGYSGPYSSAWTIENTFDAQFINVINLTANSITSGVIRDSTGQNYWDLESGTVQIASIENELNDRLRYIRLVGGTIYLGEEGNELMLTLTNNRLSFVQNGSEIAYFNNNRLYVTTGEFMRSMQVGNFAFIPAQIDGSVSFVKVV